MENNNMENLKLEDDILEAVSGGSLYRAGTETKYCPRCRAVHKLAKYANCTVKYFGDTRFAVQYVCNGLRSTDDTFKFYELEYRGTIIRLDQFFNEIV